MTTFTPTQKAMAICPKCSGFVSLCSSAYLIQHILRSGKRRNLTYHRLLLGMSVSDFFGSLVCFLSTWPIPKGEAYLAAGTVRTCTVQGFFDQTAALCTPTYNVSLAIYYLLVIVRGWKQKRVAKVEKYLHALPIVAGFGTGIAALVLKLYNSAGWICWIAPGLPNHPERHNPDYWIYRIAFMYAEAWFINGFLAVAMVIVYVHVLKQEKRLDKYQHRWMRQSRQKVAFAQKKREQSKKIRNQAFLYVGCMYVTWLFGSISRMMQFAGKRPPDAIIVLFVTFFPLQGFFNLVVYMFPRIMRHFGHGIPLTMASARGMRDFGKRMSLTMASLKRSNVLASMRRKKDSSNGNQAENTTFTHDQLGVGTTSSVAAPDETEGGTGDAMERNVSFSPMEVSIRVTDGVDAEVCDTDGNIEVEGNDTIRNTEEEDFWDDNELNTKRETWPGTQPADYELNESVRRSMLAMEELARIIQA